MKKRFHEIQELLSIRAQNVLNGLEVRDVTSFMRLSKKDLLDARNCGKKTVEEIEQFQTVFRSNNSISNQSPTQYLVRSESLNEISFPSIKERLSVRGTRIIEDLGISNLEAFLNLTTVELFKCRNCGRTTVIEIERLQGEVRNILQNDEAKCSESNTYLNNGSDHDYCDYNSVSNHIDDSNNILFIAICGCLSKRAKNIFGTLNIDNFSSFMELDRIQLFDCKNIGKKTVNEIIRIQRDILTFINELLSKSATVTPDIVLSAPCLAGLSFSDLSTEIGEELLIDVENPFPWFAKWVRGLTRSEKNAKAFMLRKGMLGMFPMTLEQVGAEIGVTRERTRQIEVALEKKASLKPQQIRLRPMIKETTQIVDRLGGMISLEELTDKLLNKGEDGSKLKYATGLIEFISELKVWEDENLELKDEHVILRNMQLNLKQFARVVEDIAPTIADEWHNSDLWSVDLIQLKISFIESIQNDSEIPLKNVSSALFYSIIKELKRSAKPHGDRLYSIGLWKLRHGKLMDAVEETLHSIKKQAHFTKVAEQLRKWRPDIEDRNIHAVLDRSRKAWLWARGTFIHRDHAIVPHSLMQDIENWLVTALEDEVPFVSAYGAYGRYRKRCNQAGMFSEVALYTCLKHTSNPKLVFPKIPYIYLRQTYTEYMPISVALEHVLLDAGGSIKIKDLRELAIKRMFIKEFQFSQAIYNIPNTIQASRSRIIHIDNVGIDRSTILPLIEHAQDILKVETHFAVNKLFHEKQVTCMANGIENAEMLYSLLQFHNDGSLKLERSPRIERPSNGEEKDRHGISTLIIEYIRNSGKPCPYEILEKRFVQKLKYREQQVYMVANSNHVVYYHRGCLIHKDTLEWNETKQKDLELLACQQYSSAKRAGRYFGRISQLVESPNLPKLPLDVFWSGSLVADLLKKEGRFVFLGNTREAFVPYSSNGSITNLEDLVALLLEEKWKGAANLASFEEMLVKERIIKRHLTPSMLGENDKVVIRNREIGLKELMVNAV